MLDTILPNHNGAVEAMGNILSTLLVAGASLGSAYFLSGSSGYVERTNEWTLNLVFSRGTNEWFVPFLFFHSFSSYGLFSMRIFDILFFVFFVI